MPSRGFQSSVDYILTFGVGDLAKIDSVVVEWPNGELTTRKDVAPNQKLVISQPGAVPSRAIATVSTSNSAPPILADVTAPGSSSRTAKIILSTSIASA